MEAVPSALDTIFSEENDEPEFDELRALIIFSPLSLLSIQPTTTLLLSEVIVTESTVFVELNFSGVPKESPSLEDLANSALYTRLSASYCSQPT